MATELSTRQKEIVDYIRRHVNETGYPPTVREIGREIGISSTSVVAYNLKVLGEKGYLTRDPETSRGLRLVEKETRVPTYETLSFAVPILGPIAAGAPIQWPDTNFSMTDYDSITLTHDILPPAPDLFALRVKGDSMIDALVNDGDIVILREQNVAENGDMVAAWLVEENETTLKRFYWRKGDPMVRLQPANPRVAPIFVHPANLEIKGKVVAVIRQV